MRQKKQQRRRRRAGARLIKWGCFGLLCCFLFLLLVGPAGESETFPESLLELLEKNPEAREFVMNYAENKDKEWDRDVSEEVTKGEIPLFLQCTKRTKRKPSKPKNLPM